MRHPRWWMVMGCWALVPGLASAAVAGHGRQDSAAPAPARAGQAGTVDPAGVHRKLKRSKAEVSRLQHDVAEQESRSRQADQRLQEQDKALAELRRQLQAVEQGGGQASGHDP